jgi:glycosyltransferase involved in cell wall biosynthesis
MKFAIYTTELIVERRWRMPWRTVLEVAENWQRMGHEIIICSGDGTIEETEIAGLPVFYVVRPKTEQAINRFVELLVSQEIKRLYFPIAPGRVNRVLVRALTQKGIDLVWYFPGSWYTVSQVISALKVMPWRSLVPYIIQAVFPKKLWISMLRGDSDIPVITMTPFTAERLVSCGYSRERVFPVFPGKSPVVRETYPFSAECQKVINHVCGKQFFVFFGPPSAIRGVLHLLRAFKRVTRENLDCHLVCLFRADENITNEHEVVISTIEALNLGSQLLANWASVTPSELDWFLKNAFAVLKPFVIVPSEIPLAVIETAEYGKPVIGFSGDGTGEYIAKIGIAVKRGSTRLLADAMLKLLASPDYYRDRCDAAKQVYNRHPLWRDVAAQWLQISGGEK